MISCLRGDGKTRPVVLRTAVLVVKRASGESIPGPCRVSDSCGLDESPLNMFFLANRHPPKHLTTSGSDSRCSLVNHGPSATAETTGLCVSKKDINATIVFRQTQQLKKNWQSLPGLELDRIVSSRFLTASSIAETTGPPVWSTLA